MNYSRAFWIWCCLVAGMIFNAALREVILIPAVGNLAAHIVSTTMGVSFLFGITLLTLAWIGPRSLGDGSRLGATWLLLTITFESLASYLIFGASWHTLLAGYQSLRGRIWLLMLCAQLFSPLLVIRIWRQSYLVNPEPEPHFLTVTARSLFSDPRSFLGCRLNELRHCEQVLQKQRQIMIRSLPSWLRWLITA